LILAVIIKAFMNIQEEDLINEFNSNEGLIDEVIGLLKYEAKQHD